MRVLVTASSRGIGFGVAKVLLQRGHEVTINGSSEEHVRRALEALSPLGKVHGVTADITRREEVVRLVSEAVKAMGGLEGLVYIAPPPRPGRFEELSPGDWELGVRQLLLNAVWLVQESLPHLKRSRGSLVLLSSFAIREPVEVLALSNVIRISLAGLTRTLARELGKYGIRVNMVLPGNIETDRSRQVIESRARAKGVSYEEELKAEMADVPLGRIGKPEEVGEVVEFLLSERASYVSGAAIPVDGGLLHGVF
jgi:Dehydrogenases with different specificities (related to short-chain alcohol dehydrogenases)